MKHLCFRRTTSIAIKFKVSQHVPEPISGIGAGPGDHLVCCGGRVLHDCYGAESDFFWLIEGSGVFIVGWRVVGLPLVALGDRIQRLPYLISACLGGVGGAVLMISPDLIARLMDPQTHYAPFSMRDFAWPDAAFVIAAGSTALYRFLLGRSTNRNGS